MIDVWEALKMLTEVVAITNIETPPAEKPKKYTVARKKHLHKKKCEHCGKVYKGLMGLNIHKAKIHGK